MLAEHERGRKWISSYATFLDGIGYLAPEPGRSVSTTHNRRGDLCGRPPIGGADAQFAFPAQFRQSRLGPYDALYGPTPLSAPPARGGGISQRGGAVITWRGLPGPVVPLATGSLATGRVGCPGLPIPINSSAVAATSVTEASRAFIWSW